MKKILKRGLIKAREEKSKVYDLIAHNSLNRQAKEYLFNVEKVNGKTNPKLIKLSDEYAKEVLGSKKYAPWLYIYIRL